MSFYEALLHKIYHCKHARLQKPIVFNNKTDTVIFNPKQSQSFLDGAQCFILLNKYLKCSLQSRWAFSANWRRWASATGKVKSWNVSKILKRACNIKVCTNYSVKGLFVGWQHQRKKNAWRSLKKCFKKPLFYGSVRPIIKAHHLKQQGIGGLLQPEVEKRRRIAIKSELCANSNKGDGRSRRLWSTGSYREDAPGRAELRMMRSHIQRKLIAELTLEHPSSDSWSLLGSRAPSWGRLSWWRRRNKGASAWLWRKK